MQPDRDEAAAREMSADMQPFEAHAALTDAIANIYHGGFTLARWAKLLEQVNDALLAERRAAREEGAREMREAAAKTADGYACGACGMDGKAAAAIRALPLPGEEGR